MSIRERGLFIELPLASGISAANRGIDEVGRCGILENAFLFAEKSEPSHRDQLKINNR